MAIGQGNNLREFYIADTATKEIYAFRVKPVFKSAKENTFVYHIKPGTYALLKYQYHESKWYGVKEFHEPVAKADKSYYMFTVGPNSVVNLGNWHFDKQPASFTEPSDDFKDKLAAEFKNLSSLDETISLIFNYPWDTERNLASVELTCPSVHILEFILTPLSCHPEN